MTESEARAESERLAAEHPDRATATWVPREEASGEWVVVKVPRPRGQLKREELQTGFGDDVRPDPSQDVPREPNPYWGF
jgi:hypothetical protein